jgi:hypothetical protein
MTTLNSKTITYAELAKVIDHSLLRPELNRTGGNRWLSAGAPQPPLPCASCRATYPPGCWLLKGSDVKVASGLDFPMAAI